VVVLVDGIFDTQGAHAQVEAAGKVRAEAGGLVLFTLASG
jgi:hypothetical protein